MDEAHFDALTRWVTTRASRRSTLGAAVAGALTTALSFLDTEAKPCQKKCGPCKKCNKKTGKCKPKPDGTICGEGKACLKGKCTCKGTHFACGPDCCLDGATCLPVLGSMICVYGTKQLGEKCNPAKPGACASGQCGQYLGSFGSCRKADCKARQQVCASLVDCCSGDCRLAEAACGGGKRCCSPLHGSCQEDCDCCFFPDKACRQGHCCIVEFGACGISAECCDGLFCHEGQCL
jgi:hypothetical protein